MASHGDAHYKRSNISADLFEKDLGVSVEKLRSWTGRVPATYAYPHGNTVEGDRPICAKYFSHVVTVKAPDGIAFEVPQPTQIVVSGISKQQVGEIAAQIRKWRPPEPYKGKGIRYQGEHVIRKVGKRA